MPAEQWWETVVRRIREQEEADAEREAERVAAAIALAEVAVEHDDARAAWDLVGEGAAAIRYAQALWAYRRTRR